jgi:hypothetical protein
MYDFSGAKKVLQDEMMAGLDFFELVRDFDLLFESPNPLKGKTFRHVLLTHLVYSVSPA